MMPSSSTGCSGGTTCGSNWNCLLLTLLPHPALLLNSLHNTLRPRWQFLSQLQDERAGFVAKDHLAALATLSDERFVHLYNRAGLAIDRYGSNSMAFYGFCASFF